MEVSPGLGAALLVREQLVRVEVRDVGEREHNLPERVAQVLGCQEDGVLVISPCNTQLSQSLWNMEDFPDSSRVDGRRQDKQKTESISLKTNEISVCRKDQKWRGRSP